MASKQAASRCQVDDCKRAAVWAINTTLMWSSNDTLTVDVHTCAKHCSAHEKQTGRRLPLERKTKAGKR